MALCGYCNKTYNLMYSMSYANSCLCKSCDCTLFHTGPISCILCIMRKTLNFTPQTITDYLKSSKIDQQNIEINTYRLEQLISNHMALEQ